MSVSGDRIDSPGAGTYPSGKMTLLELLPVKGSCAVTLAFYTPGSARISVTSSSQNWRRASPSE